MSQSSSREGSLSESRGRWDRGRELLVNGLARAERTYIQVATDGGRTRYPGGAYEVRENERARKRQLGWYRRMEVLSQIWDEAFFVA